MALIADKIILNPKATASAPSGSEGSLYYDSDKDALMAYDSSWQMVSRATGSGGTITTYTGYKVHTFLLADSGNDFVVSGGSLTCDYLIVAGGGAGGFGRGGGGGAGGVLIDSVTLSTGSYDIVVGAGAASMTEKVEPIKGSNSSFNGNTAIGGGGGVCEDWNSGVSGQSGGSGGGGCGAHRLPGGSGTSGQGYAGGDAIYSVPNYGGGGGGGKSAVGGDGTTTAGGSGGNGVQNLYRTGANQWYGGGGGAGVYSTGGTPGSGGSGGGGDANYQAAGDAGTADTGGGGGGGHGGPNQNGGAGGSGIVVIRYAT